MKISPRVRKGCLDTLLIVIMTGLPTLIACCAEEINNKFDFTTHYLSGEFLLYSISFFCASFLVFNERTVGRKDWKSYANSFIFIVVAAIAAFYGIILTAERPNESLIRIVTLIALFISVPAFLFSQIINNTPPPDIQAQRTSESQLIQNSIS